MKKLLAFCSLMICNLFLNAQEQMDFACLADSAQLSDIEFVADSTDMADSLQVKPRKSFFQKVLNFADGVTNFFMGCDTDYVTPQLYEFTTQAELSYWHDYYRMTSSHTGTTNSMTLQSGNPLILGGYVYWSILGYGYSTDVKNLNFRGGSKITNHRNSFTLNTARIVAEIYTFKSGKSAEITGITNLPLKKEDKEFDGLSSECFGIDAQYIFNHKRYSWPAAFGENAVQRRSQGSWKLGFSYNITKVDFDASRLSPYVVEHVDSTLLFNHVSYRDYAVSFGYGYNWAFRRNCLLAVSVLPALGYRHADISGKVEHSILRKISTDVVFRASIFWNNTRVFSGFVLDFHTYSYREHKFGLTNTYGTLKYIIGFNFLKKK